MPMLNPDKCYTQQNKRLPIKIPKVFPANWLADFYKHLAALLVQQKNTNLLLIKEECFFEELNKHVGKKSIFTYKSQLLELLGTVYSILIDSSTSVEQRQMIACRIAEDVSECTPGFMNRVSFIITLFNMPQNIDELIALVRFKTCG